MSRQAIGLIVVLLLFVGLLVVRAGIGDGMGRVYSERTTVEMVEVEVPILDVVEGEPVESIGTETVWVEAASDDAADFANGQSPRVSWETTKPIKPAAYFADPENPSFQLDWPRTIGIWLAAIFTLAIFSFLYRDNAIYKVAESVVVGVSAGYSMVIGFWDMIVPNLLGKLAPTFVQTHFIPGMTDLTVNWLYIVPAIFGVLLLMRLAPKGQWLSLWALAFIVGTTAAIRMVGYIEGDFLSQINATVMPIYQVVDDANGSVDVYSTVWASIRQAVLLIGVLACLAYFFFSVEHKGVVGGVARVGIWFLMITFGAAFGFTVMGRIALLAARFEFLFDDWLWLIDPTNQRVVAAATGMLGF